MTMVNVITICGFTTLYVLLRILQPVSDFLSHVSKEQRISLFIYITEAMFFTIVTILSLGMSLCLQTEGGPWPLHQSLCRGKGGLPPYSASLLPAPPE